MWVVQITLNFGKEANMRISFIVFLVASLLGGCATSSDVAFRNAYYGNSAVSPVLHTPSTDARVQVLAPCVPYRADTVIDWAMELPDRKQSSRSVGMQVSGGSIDCFQRESGSSQTGDLGRRLPEDRVNELRQSCLFGLLWCRSSLSMTLTTRNVHPGTAERWHRGWGTGKKPCTYGVQGESRTANLGIQGPVRDVYGRPLYPPTAELTSSTRQEIVCK